MTNKLFSVFTFFVACLSLNSAMALPYFSAEKISPTLLDKPLDRTSEEYEDEVAAIIKMQKKPDIVALKLSKVERVPHSEMVVHLVDDRLNRKDYPKLYNLLDRSLETALAVNENCKNHWNTKRPFVSEKKIKALIEPSQNPAYPSGHTASSQVLARILGQLIPEKSEAFMARAEEISNHRVLVGMHYPHDIVGGKKMALIILGALFASDDFAKDYQSAKEEINSKYPKNFVSKN